MSAIPYPVVPFRQKINGVTLRRKGYQIGDVLVVSTTDNSSDLWSIFNVLTLTTVIPNQFVNFSDALKVAELMRDIFGELWLINVEWPELDILRCGQWTVENGHGIQLFLALSSLAKQDIITLSDVQQAWVKFKDEAQEQMRRYVHIT